jgi:hypothetical protein
MDQYFVRLFRAMKIAMPPDIHHFLTFKQMCRSKRRAKRQLKETKKDRVKHKYAKIATEEANCKRDATKRLLGSYKRGQNMSDGGADGYTAEELLAVAATKPKARSNRSLKDAKCPFCHKLGHVTNPSKACLFFKKPLPVQPSTVASAQPKDDDDDEDAAQDLDNYEQLDINNDDVSLGSLALYQDAGTWSSDDEDVDRRI